MTIKVNVTGNDQITVTASANTEPTTVITSDRSGGGGLKVNVGASQQIRSVPLQDTNRSIVAQGEKKPVILPDSVVLGIDTIGDYVSSIYAGNGIYVSPMSSSESANVVISHANTSNEISTDNDSLTFINNIDIDVFGHTTGFVNLSLNPDNFLSDTNIVSTKSIFLGSTELNSGDSTSNIEGLIFVSTSTLEATDEILTNQITSLTGDIVLSPSGAVSVSNANITDLADPVNNDDAVNLNYLENTFARSFEIIEAGNTYTMSLLSDDPKLIIGNALNADFRNNELTLGLRNTSVDPGIYGTDGFTPRISITPDGRVDFATEIPIQLQANAIPDFTETTRDIIGEMFRLNVEEGITIVHNDPENRFDVYVDNFDINLVGDISGSARVNRLSNTTIVTTVDVDYVSNILAGDGITIDGTQNPDSTFTISHADTSNISNTNNTNGNVISNLVFDTYGHVKTTATVNLDSRYLQLTGGTLSGNIAAPRFVDSNDTDYYLDPASVSRINSLIIGYGKTFSQIQLQDGLNTASYIYAGNGRVGFLNNSFNYTAYSERSTSNWVVPNGSVLAESVNDSDNSAYFIKPSAIDSRINGLLVDDSITFNNNLTISYNTVQTLFDNLILRSASGIVDVDNSIISNIAPPVNGLDAINKNYLDAETANTTNFVNQQIGNTITYIDGQILQTRNYVDTKVTNLNPLSVLTPLLTVDGANSSLDSDLLDGQHGSYYLNFNNLTNVPEFETANVSPEVILSSLLTVDGANSGLDADLLDGQDGSYYLNFNNFVNVPTFETANVSPEVILSSLLAVDGANSGLDSDLLDGQDGSYYLDFNNLTNVPETANVSPEVILSSLLTVDGANSGLDSDLLDGQHGSYYLNFDNFINVPESANVSPEVILSSLLTVDGANSGLDADLLDGQDGSFYLDFNNLMNVPAFETANASPEVILGSLLTVDGANSGLDADLLDGQDGSFYLDFNNLTNVPAFEAANVSPESILSSLLTVDGANSGLDADLLDGQDGSYYLDFDNFVNVPESANVSPEAILVSLLTVDGANSGLDADLLDGQDGSFYLNFNNLTNVPESANVSPEAILTSLITVDGAGSGLDSDLLDGQDGSFYLNFDNFINVPETQFNVSLIGNVTGTGLSANGSIEIQTEIANTGVTPGSYGSASRVPVIIIGRDGRISSASSIPVADVSTPSAGIDGFGWDPVTDTLSILTSNGENYSTVINDFSNISVDGNIIIGGTVDGRNISDDGNKLDTIEAGATADQTAGEILSALLTVDGANSGLDADLLDGFDSSYFIEYTNAVANSISDSLITIDAGTSISGGGTFTLNQSSPTVITINHADTSNVGDVSTSNRNVISGLTFDGHGHVTGSTTRTLDFVTPAEANTNYVNVTGDTMTGTLEVRADILQKESALTSESLTANSIAQFTLFSSSSYGAAEVIITAKEGINRHITKLLVTHDNATAYATEFGTVYTNTSLADYDVFLVSGDVLLQITPTSGITTEYKIISTLISF